MRTCCHILLLSLLAGSFSFMSLQAKSNGKTRTTQSLSEDRHYVPNIVVLKLRDRVHVGTEAVTTGFPALDKQLQSIGATRLSQVLPGSHQSEKINRQVAIESIYNVRYSKEISPLLVAEALRHLPEVEYAEAKRFHYPQAIPNDPDYTNMAQFTQVMAEAAWDIVKGEDGEVVIGIVDGGTDWDHSDLIDNIWSNVDEIAGNGIDDDNNGYVDDVRGWNFANNSNDPTGLPTTPSSARHGTHVAGIAGATTNNGSGIASLSWNCTILPVCVASPTNDGTYVNAYDGIAYAAANGADIINCSWGGGGTGSSFEEDIIQFALDNGALVIASAGNGGDDQIGDNNDIIPHFPSGYRAVLSVGATGKTSDVRRGFSNFGVTTDVYAPGSAILSTNNGGGYVSLSGTSMSSPMTAALAGLIKTQNPGFSPEEVREQIRSSSDPIESSNPGLSGLLGKGRINALRALTEFGNPSIRITGIGITDGGGNGVINQSETIDVEITVTNYLATANNVTITLVESETDVTVVTASATISTMSPNTSQTVVLQFDVSANAEDGELLSFYTDISADNYSDRDFFTLTVNPPQFVDLTTPAVTTSLTTDGNVGFTGFAGTDGSGFVHDGNNYLFEGGLMIGMNSSSVSDCVRGDDGSTQDEDFRPAAGEIINITSPGEFASTEASLLMVDSAAGNPLGLTIFQEVFADDRSENEDFVIFKYTIQNNDASALPGIHVGLFFDWDINSNANDDVRYASDRRHIYAANDVNAPSQIAATRLLTTSGPVNVRAIHNPNEIYDGFTDVEKFSWLSGGLQTQTLDNIDISTLISEGPLTIPGNGTIEVAFAVMGAANLTELNATSDAAQDFYDNPPIAINTDEGPVANQFGLAQNYPNPFNPETTIAYQIPQGGNVEIDIFNALGQKVRTLVRKNQPVGSYEVRWNGLNDLGQPVSSGIFLYRLKVRDRVDLKKMILIR